MEKTEAGLKGLYIRDITLK